VITTQPRASALFTDQKIRQNTPTIQHAQPRGVGDQPISEAPPQAYSATRMEYRARLPAHHISLKRYDGTTDYQGWANAISNAFDYMEWGLQERRQVVPTLLDERALAYYEMLASTEPAVITSYDDLMAKLKDHFAIDRQGLMATADLHSRSQGAQESVGEYAKAMYKIFAQLEIPPGRQQMVLFFKGLRPKLRLLVGRQDPRDLESCERSALQMEKVENEAPDDRIDRLTEMIAELMTQKHVQQNTGESYVNYETTPRDRPQRFNPRGYDPGFAHEQIQNQQQPMQQGGNVNYRPRNQAPGPFCTRCNAAHTFGEHLTPAPNQPRQQAESQVRGFTGGQKGHCAARCANQPNRA